MSQNFNFRAIARDLAIILPALAVALGACDVGERSDLLAPDAGAQVQYIGIPCTASVVLRTVECGAGEMPENLSADIIGGQNTYVKLTSSNITLAGNVFSFDVTVQNLMNEAIGTPDGVTPDPDGIQVFFLEEPVANGGGTMTVANADGTGTFTSADQAFFRYNEILDKDEVSGAKNWQFNLTGTVTTYSFRVWLRVDRQFLLVINEVMANPVGAVSTEQPLEWFEIYNAGTLKVDLQNLVIADSAASGRRPYHVIASSVVVPAGGYAVLGGSTNTTLNGGVPVDYSYGTALNQLANSLDAVKIARVYGNDTLTIDRTQYASAAVSAQEGVSRELKNPALDNSNMDGSNWASALVTAVYGAGGRGTPKAQNSQFVPSIIETPVVMSRRATLPTFRVTRR